MEYFTSTTGNDELNDGRSPGAAFATVQRGVRELQPGDRLRILAGTYVERVRIGGKGTKDPANPSDPSRIEPFDGDVVVIDGGVNTVPGRTENVFRQAGNDDWRRVGDTDE